MSYTYRGGRWLVVRTSPGRAFVNIMYYDKLKQAKTAVRNLEENEFRLFKSGDDGVLMADQTSESYRLWETQRYLHKAIRMLQSPNLSDFSAQLIVRLRSELNAIEDRLGILRSN